ncbi:MAG: hypothetical protein SVC26_06185, partial [Pseudomonadota bacterium]|nr:hypothetical protein [Pseudomonadota bacterium]
MNKEALEALDVDASLVEKIIGLHEAGVKASVESEVNGLKAKNQELLGKNQEFKAFRQEVEPILNFVSTLKASEQDAQQAELAKQGKFDELFELKSKPLQHKNAELEKALADAQAAKEQAVAKYNETLIVNAMNAAISEAKVFIPEAANIAKLHANHFEVVDGAVITKEGKPVADWINSDFKQSNPFLIAQGQGSGANGSGGKAASKPFKQMNEQERIDLYRSNPVEFEK